MAIMVSMNKDKVKHFNKTVGSILNKARRRTGLSVFEVSNYFEDLNSVNISSIESGKASIRCDQLYELFQKYEFTNDELFFFMSVGSQEKTLH
jgi:ribosome-binding protein aMBF1 (putative translation factor)